MVKIPNSWDAVRIIRLLSGVGFGVYAIFYKEYPFLILAAFLITQAIFNTTCCGVSRCEADSKVVKTKVFKGQIKQYKK